MNTKDFVVLPWGKPGHSVKLKYKSSGYHWKSGKVGKLGNQSYIMSQNKGNVIKISHGKLKLKLLKEQLQESGKQPLNYKLANSSASEKPKMKGKFCGQCENKAALLVCLECGEDYCSGCFAKIHQKGALKLHRTTLLQAKSQILSNVLDVAHQFIKEVNPNEPKRENHSTEDIIKTPLRHNSPLLQGSSSEMEVSTTQKGECTNPRDRLMCEGSFDEEASAQSFQEALNEWRTRHHSGSEKQNLPAVKPDSLEECEVQTNLTIWREPLHIEFKEDSISYMEKLWLKKHRRTPLEQLQNLLPHTLTPQCTAVAEAQHSQDENGGDSDAKETEVQYPVLLLPVEELSIETPQTSVKIVELDDTYEEEVEEQGNTVPYKVQLADADSQQRKFNAQKKIGELRILPDSKSGPEAETSSTKFDNDVGPDVYSPAVEKLGESNISERHFKEKTIKDMESNQKLDNACLPFESKDFLPSVDLEAPSTKEKLSQDIKGSLEFSNLPERPDFEDSKTTESPLLLQEIAQRSKPVTEKYQGLERFFVSDENERLHTLPSHNIECGSSSFKITIAGDRDWIADHSVSTCANSEVALGVVRSAQSSSRSRTQPWMDKVDGQTSPKPSTADFPLSSSGKSSSHHLSFSRLPPRSESVQLLSRAASEISEMEHIHVTGDNEPFLENVEKESNVLKNLPDHSGELYSLTSEDSPAFNYNLLNVSQSALDFFKTSRVRSLCGNEELSSSEKDTEVQSFLTLSESSTEEEEEEFS